MKLSIRNLNKEYKRKDLVFPAVKNVNLEVSGGEFISIIGHSGSGKSTLLNLIAGLLLPTSGEILLDEKNAVLASDKQASEFRNDLFGHIPQGYSLLSNFTVFDNVRLPFFFKEREGDSEENTLELLRKLGIEHLSECYPRTLSGGEARRVAIARALINHPKILLADEPTNDLDTGTKNEIISLFRQIANEGTTVIMVTHDLSTILASDKVYSMENGDLKEYIQEKSA